MSLSRYVCFTREEWAKLRAATPLMLSEADLIVLRGINEMVSLQEVAEIYLPLSRLLNLHVAAMQGLYAAPDTFLGTPATRVPYVIGIAGSVAVGKSTTARILQALLARWPHHPRVDLVTTARATSIPSRRASCGASTVRSDPVSTRSSTVSCLFPRVGNWRSAPTNGRCWEAIEER
jgi:hypothetical protein